MNITNVSPSSTDQDNPEPCNEYDQPFDFCSEIVKRTGELKKEIDHYENELIESIISPK
jgi:hypothetical protein